MSFSSSRRILCSSSSTVVVVLVSLVVLQIWVCCDSCKAGAIRIFPENAMAVAELKRESTKGKVLMSREEVFHKYLRGKSYVNGLNKTEKGFDESKRRVPSCPDPLHN